MSALQIVSVVTIPPADISTLSCSASGGASGGEGGGCATETKEGVDLNVEHLNLILSKVPEGVPVSVLSIVGAFRTGKSFILTFFLRYLRCTEKKLALEKKYILKRGDDEEGGDDDYYDVVDDWMFEEGDKLSEGNRNSKSSLTETEVKDSFAWRGGVERVTTGIWMWSEPFIIKSESGEDMALLLMDTQGMFDNETSMTLTSQIFGLSTLVSSCLIYNVDKHIGEDNLQSLALFSEYGRIAMEYSSSGGLGGKLRAGFGDVQNDKDSDNDSEYSDDEKKPFQRLQFLIRDYQNFEAELDEKFYAEKIEDKVRIIGEIDTLIERYLESVLPNNDFNLNSYSVNSELQVTRNQIRRCFQQISCFMMPYPGSKVTRQNYDGSIEKIDPFFRVMLSIYIKRLFTQLEPKFINNRPIGAQELKKFFEVYVSMFQKMDDSKDKDAAFPNAQSLLEATAEANNANAFELSLASYNQQMMKDSKDKGLLTEAAFMAAHNVAHRRALLVFNSMASIGREEAIESYRRSLEDAINTEKQKYLETNSLKDPYKDMAALAFVAGKYESALDNLQQSLKLTKQYFGLETNEVAAVLSSIANVQDRQGKSRAALESYEQAMVIKKRTLGENHVEIADLYSKMGHVYAKDNEFEPALKTFKAALGIYENLFGKINLQVAAASCDIGMVYDKQGLFVSSIEMYSKALEVQKQLLGIDHVDIAATLCSIGLLNYNNGKNKLAIEYFNEALRIRETTYGKDHPTVADTLSNIAFIYDKTASQCEVFGNYREALENYKSALCITEGLLGHETLEVAVILNSIANVNDKLKQFELALESYNECLRIRQCLLGQNNEEVADTFASMASLLEKEKRVEVALVMLNESLRIKESLYGKDHLAVASLYTSVGELFESQKDFEAALTNYSESLRIKKYNLTTGSPNSTIEHWIRYNPTVTLSMSDSLLNIASICALQGKEEGAIQIYNQALSIRRSVLGREHPDIAKILTKIAKIYENQSHFEAAIHCYNEDLRIKKEIYKENQRHADIEDTIMKIERCKSKLNEKMANNDKLCIIS